ncbi:conserved protein, unknown function [Hepatocystis sp. ex Piliocolobus tephrosceles]|nr:conserved protein, unknown function [Hepatocystis sp. ex Piliocolobus tephrosceles]
MMIKYNGFMPTVVPTKRVVAISEKNEYTKNKVLKKLISKIIKIKQNNRFYNCSSYLHFLQTKYLSLFSVKDCFELLHFQNKDYFFNKKLISYIFTKINNTSVHNLLKIKNEYIINNICTCNINKYKYIFPNEYYTFIHNILLLCCLQICKTDICLENKNEKIKKKYLQLKHLKLRHLNTLFSPSCYNITFDKTKNKKQSVDQLKIFTNLYKCFTNNNIYPFSFFNKYFYHYYYLNLLFFKKLTSTKYHTIINKQFISYNIYRQINLYKDQLEYLNSESICKILFYLAKNNLHFYYDLFLRTYYFYILHWLYKKKTFNHINNKSDHTIITYRIIIDKINLKEQTIIDKIITSFIIFLSSFYVLKKLKKKQNKIIFSIFFCIYTFLTLLNFLYKQHALLFNPFKCEPQKKMEKISSKQFVLICEQHNPVYLQNLSFIKKCLFCVYVINDIIREVFKNYLLHNKSTLHQNIFNNKKMNINHLMLQKKKILFTHNNNKLKQATTNKTLIHNYDKVKNINSLYHFLNKNLNQFLKNSLSKKNAIINIFHFIPFHILKMFYYQIFIYTEYKKNEKIINEQKSKLEMEIFYILQQYLKKNVPTYYVRQLRHVDSYRNVLFTIDMCIYKKPKH